MTAAQTLRELGFFIPAIRYPTVARGQARLRITLTADHTAEEIFQLRAALAKSVFHEGAENSARGGRGPQDIIK